MEEEQGADQEEGACAEADPWGAGQADDQIAHGADHRNERRVGDLCFDVADMRAARAGRGEDRGVGDRRAVVAVDRARKRRAERRDQNRAAAGCGADHRDDRDQHAEGAPRGAHREGHQRGDHKDQKRQQPERQVRRRHEAGDELAGADHLTAYAAETPREDQNQHGRHDASDAADDRVHKFLRFQNLARQVHQQRGDQRGKRAERQARGRVFANGLGERDALEEAADVGHAENRADDQHDDGQNEVDHLTLRLLVGLGKLLLDLLIALLLRELLRLPHFAEVHAGEADEHDHDDREQGVEVVRDRGEEGVEAVGLADLGRHRDRPGRDRRDDADRRGSRVDNVRQLLAGNPLPVVDRAHDRADGQAVKAVVDEDQHAQQRGCKLRRPLAFELALRPFAVGGGASRAADQRDDRPEQGKEDDHVGVVGDLRRHHVEGVGEDRDDRLLRKNDVDRHAGKHAEKQRGIDLLGQQRQRDRNERGKNGKPAGFDHGFSPPL